MAQREPELMFAKQRSYSQHRVHAQPVFGLGPKTPLSCCTGDEFTHWNLACKRDSLQQIEADSGLSRFTIVTGLQQCCVNNNNAPADDTRRAVLDSNKKVCEGQEGECIGMKGLAGGPAFPLRLMSRVAP